MISKLRFFLLFTIFIQLKGFAQSSGGDVTYSFLNIPSSARHQYLGRAAIASYDSDLSLALANPSYLDHSMPQKILASTNFYYTSLYNNVAYSGYSNKLDMPFQIGANVISYGKQNLVDMEGNTYGVFNPMEMSFYFSGEYNYGPYRFGSTLKFAYGNYHKANTGGIAADFSALYYDEEREIQAAFMIKNAGYQFLGINASNYGMPFDLQFAFSKRLKHLPFRYTIMAHDLYQWNILYGSDDYFLYPLKGYETQKSSFINNLLGHLVFSGEFLLGKAFKVGFNYDLQRSKDLSFEYFKGISGLGIGFGIYTRKFDIGYSFSKLSSVGEAHHFSIVINTNEWFLRRSRR